SQIFRAFVQFMRNASAEMLGQSTEREVRQELYANLLSKSMTFHGMQSVGDIMARATNDVHELNLMLNPGVNLVVGSLMFMIFPILFSPTIRFPLVVAPGLFTIGYAITVTIYTRQLRQVTEDVRARFGDMNARLAESIDGIETVKGASQEHAEVEIFDYNATAFRDAFVRQSDIEARFIPLLLLGIATGGAFLHALVLYRAGQMNVGEVVQYMGYMSLFGFPVFTSLFGFSNISLGMAAARRILSLIWIRTDLDRNPGGYNAPIRGEVEFDHVTFCYPGGHVAVEGVTLCVEPSQVVALVGQTGVGKSTLAKLINRTYDVSEGCLRIDGVDVRDWNLEALRSQISIIEQDIFLFSRTIAENIAFGFPDATQEQIEAAARDAQAHDFIMAFKDGYQTEVGSRGITLSGGQRQRIALARAFLTNPRILILDDSTSAIDSATEDQIQRAIHRATQGRTTFLITHRLSQIRWADQIVVLRRGRIAARGTHAELMETSEAYRRIFVAGEPAITS
ncbi:MAG TPA: ABC transporter ATP-binding protein, partial [Aggregatilineales bacterium]|nr:ABC transporter ATP-binding protein [Aggregatilineales bacterium]